MNLAQYVHSKPRGELSRIHRATGVAYNWLVQHVGGNHKFSRYETAKRVSDYTGGAVTIESLCTLQPGAHKPAKRKVKARKRAKS